MPFEDNPIKYPKPCLEELIKVLQKFYYRYIPSVYVLAAIFIKFATLAFEQCKVQVLLVS
jgi:multisubunit Na+/H+ antiporter MnhC subunit